MMRNVSPNGGHGESRGCFESVEIARQYSAPPTTDAISFRRQKAAPSAIAVVARVPAASVVLAAAEEAEADSSSIVRIAQASGELRRRPWRPAAA